MPRKLLVVTDLDIWMLTVDVKKAGTGNQSMYNMLMGYARAGWQVHLLTSNRCLADMPSIHENVTVHRRPVWTERLLIWLNNTRKSLKARLSRRGKGDGKIPFRPTLPLETRGNWIRSQLFKRIMSRRAVRLARQLGGVDLIYGYEIFGALAGNEAARKLGLPLITRFQGTLLSALLDRPAEIRQRRSQVNALTVPSDMLIMTNDGTLGNKVLDLLGVPASRYRYWMNGVVKDDVYRPDVDKAAIRERLGVAPGEALVLHTGRMFFWKRIDRHVEAIARAAETQRGFKAVFIGDGPDRPAVEQLVNRLGLSDRVRLLGALPHDEVMDYLNACDIYLCCYDVSNLSNSLIESCICGKCIVTTAAGGTTDLVTDGENAVVVSDPTNAAAIGDALARAIADADLRRRLSEGALQRGRELKTWAERMEMEIAEVEQMLTRRRATSRGMAQ